MVRRTPVLSLASILVLGCGVGITTALFSVLYSVLLRPLPYADHNRLAIVAVNRLADGGTGRGPTQYLLTGAEVRAVQTQTNAFDAVTWFELWTTNPGARQTLTDVHNVERLSGALVASNFFEVAGIKPLLGRTFRDDDTPDVVVISNGLWTRQFARSPNILGRTIRLDGSTKSIIGVLPPSIRLTYPRDTDFWCLHESRDLFAYGLEYHVLARLRPGTSLSEASADLERMSEVEKGPGRHPRRRLSARTVEEWVAGSNRPALMLLSGGAMLLFLTSCLNAGLLLLARSARQARAAEIRAALGASRCQLRRQVLAEVSVVGVAGVTLGVFLAWVALPILLTLLPPDVPRADETRIETTVLAFAVIAGLVSAAAAGLLGEHGIAWRPSITSAASTVTVSRPALTRRRTLLVLQTAGTVVLVTSAGLLLRSFWRLSHVDLGFESSRLMAFQTRVLAGRLAREEFEMRAQHQHDHTGRGVHQIAIDLRSELHQRMRQIPGISDVAISTTLPFWDFDESTWVPQSRTVEVSRTKVPANQRTVSPEFFDLLGIRLLAGRFLTDSDTRNAPRVAVVSLSLAVALFPSGSAVGEKLHWGDAYDIVGIVEDVRWRTPEDEPRPAFYLAAAQHTPTVISVIARTSLDMQAFTQSARSVVRSIDPDQPIERIASIDSLVRSATSEKRFVSLVTIGFGLVAVLIGTAGVFGAAHSAVAERRREIALRVALGADRIAVWWLAIRHGLIPVVIGCLIGGAVSIWVGRGLRMFLFELTALDTGTLLATVIGLVMVTVTACLLPGRDALRVEPMLVLRDE